MMGEHFVLLVDRLLTESTLEAAIRATQSVSPETKEKEADSTSRKINIGNDLSPGKQVECRICQDEDEDSNMETPCSCCGSLKYAHRRCIQRWCNEKGDTICEICHQQFKPGYTAPPPLFHFGAIPMNFRGNWEISRMDLNHPRYIAMVSTDRNFLDPGDDDYSASASRSVVWCRAFAVIFVILLVLRHSLPFIANGAKEYSFPLFMLLILRTAGIVVPVYVIVRAVSSFQRRRRHLISTDSSSSAASSEDEAEELA